MKSVLENNEFVIADWEYLYLPRVLESSIISFPIKYPFSLILSHFSRNPKKLIAISKKAYADPNH